MNNDWLTHVEARYMIAAEQAAELDTRIAGRSAGMKAWLEPIPVRCDHLRPRKDSHDDRRVSRSAVTQSGAS